jgi:hypothetical protein
VTRFSWLQSGRRFGKTAAAKAALDVERMAAMYTQEHKSCWQIGKAMGCSPTTVLARLRAAGVEVRGQGKYKPKGESSPAWKGGPQASEARYNAAHGREMATAKRAQQMVRAALRTGVVARPDRCAPPPLGCGRVGVPLDAAHEDYARPLHIVWLCRRCHIRWDHEQPKIANRGHSTTP